jgi:glycerate kinase
MSSASGLALVPPSDRNPFTTTTFGTGQLLLAATKLGATHILLGIGGSATCDAGIGCCQGAGLTVLTVDGSPVSPTEPLTPRDLENILAVKHARGSPIDRVHITVACDVTNPLFGPTGAARVYGPQKGASPDDVEQLDRLLRDFATRTGKLAEAQTPGAGAAGGLGFGLLAFFNATLRPGFDLVADALRLHDRLADADLCITAEGRLDASTLHGKAPVGLARLCRPLHVPCIAVGGSVDPTALPQLQAEFSHVLPLADPPLPVDESLRRAEQLLESAGERIGTLVHRGQLPPND